VAAEAAERCGEHSEAYEACKKEADAGDASASSRRLSLPRGSRVPEKRDRGGPLVPPCGQARAGDRQCYLGLTYARALACRPNDAEAARWYQQAASQGDPIGEYFLAMALAEDMGLTRIGQGLSNCYATRPIEVIRP